MNRVEILQKSQQGIYQSKLQCQSSLSTGLFQNCWLKLFREDTPVKNTEVFINGGMPAHEHGLPTSPKIIWSDEKDSYLIQGLKFSMPGKWSLNFKVNAKDNALKDEIIMLIEVN